LIVLLVLFLLIFGSEGSARAAEFSCLDDPRKGKVVRNKEFTEEWRGLLEVFKWTGNPDQLCLRVSIDGKIVPGDADKLEWLLAPEGSRSGQSPPIHFELQSPGGNVLEAMTLGRLLRTTYSVVSARSAVRPSCGLRGQPVCCASACALVYFGGAKWEPTDRLGLHRPTLEDLGDQEFLIALKAVDEIGALIKQYLKEMEVDDRVYDLMMRAAPEQLVAINVGNGYPTTLNDWLTAKCKATPSATSKTKEELDECMSDQFRDLQGDETRLDGISSEYKYAKIFSWYPYKSTSELKKMFFERAEVGRIRRVAISKELDLRAKARRAE